MNITIDTNILKQAFDYLSLNHLSLILALGIHNYNISMDYEYKLYDEYMDELGEFPLFQKWYKELCPDRIYFCSCNFPMRHLSAITQLGLHENEDQTLLGIAFNSDKHMITEDSDFGKGNPRRAQQNIQVLNYITNQMNIIVYDSAEAMQNFIVI